jgi:hypothetical protein
MQINSTSLLEFIGKNDCLILFEKAVPAGRFKRELITLTTQQGRSVGLRASGYSTSTIEIPRVMFDDFLAASLIEQHGPEDSDGRIFFRLTRDGRERAAYPPKIYCNSV